MSDKARRNPQYNYAARGQEIRYRSPQAKKRAPLDRQARRVISTLLYFVLLWAILLVGGFVIVTRSYSSGEPRSEPTSTMISIAALPLLSSPTESPSPYPSETAEPSPTSSPVPTESPTQVACIPQVVEVEVIREITVIPQSTETQVPTLTATVSPLALKLAHDTEMIIRSESHKMGLIEFFVSPAFIVSALAFFAIIVTYAAIRIAETRKATIDETIEDVGEISDRIQTGEIATNYPTTTEVDQIRRLLEIIPELAEHPTTISKIWYDQRGGTGFYKVKRAIKVISTQSLPSPPPTEDIDY